jgi:hypothetical protein
MHKTWSHYQPRPNDHDLNRQSDTRAEAKPTIMNESYNTNDDTEPHQASHESCEASLTPFPAANNDYRYLRQRTTILCAAFNA